MSKLTLADSIRKDLKLLSESVTENDYNDYDAEYGEDTAELNDALDQIESYLRSAIDVASDLMRSESANNFGGPFTSQLSSYLIPSLESWIRSLQQPGSVASLRSMINGDM